MPGLRLSGRRKSASGAEALCCSGRRVTSPGAEALGRRLSLRPPCSKLLPFSPVPGLTVVRHVLARGGGLWLSRFSALAICPLRRFPGGYDAVGKYLFSGCINKYYIYASLRDRAKSADMRVYECHLPDHPSEIPSESLRCSNL